MKELTLRCHDQEAFCVEHGYDHMRTRHGDPIPFCQECELQDMRVQDVLRRELSTKLRTAISDAIEHGLDSELAFKAVQDLLESEEQCAATRRAFARTTL